MNNEDIQKKIEYLLRDTETKCLGDIKIVDPCDTKPFDSRTPMKPAMYHLPEWFLERCVAEAHNRGLKFEWKNPTSGWAIKIKDIRDSNFYTRYNQEDEFALGVEITWHEDDQEFVDLDAYAKGVADLLEKLDKDISEENTMSRYEETAKTEEDQDTVYFQVSVQEELLKQLDSCIERLNNRIYTVIADELPQIAIDDSNKPGVEHPELVGRLITQNDQLSAHLVRLNSIVDRVRL